jgi:hypothetical protein
VEHLDKVAESERLREEKEEIERDRDFLERQLDLVAMQQDTRARRSMSSRCVNVKVFVRFQSCCGCHKL